MIQKGHSPLSFSSPWYWSTSHGCNQLPLIKWKLNPSMSLPHFWFLPFGFRYYDSSMLRSMSPNDFFHINFFFTILYSNRWSKTYNAIRKSQKEIWCQMEPMFLFMVIFYLKLRVLPLLASPVSLLFLRSISIKMVVLFLQRLVCILELTTHRAINGCKFNFTWKDIFHVFIRHTSSKAKSL